VCSGLGNLLVDRATLVSADDSPTFDVRVHEVTIHLAKIDELWSGFASAEGRQTWLPGGSLVDVIMAAERLTIGAFPIALSRVSHRGAFHFGNIQLKVAPWTSLDAEELLALIDAIVVPERLDLTGCDLSDIDLSQPSLEARSAADPDASRGKPPYWKSVISGGVKLHGVCLREAFLNRAQLQRAELDSADLRGAHLDQANLQDARMFAANLDGAFLMETDLRRAYLMGATFSNTTIHRASLQDAMLFGSDWRGARVSESRFDRANLGGAHFEGVDLSSLEPGALSGVRWSGIFLDRTRIRREQLGGSVVEQTEAQTLQGVSRPTGSEREEVIHLRPEDRASLYRQAREVYLLLKNNFNSMGRFADASWAYENERAMERKVLGQEWRSRHPKAWLNLWHWLTNLAASLVTGYGERPERTISTAGAVIVAFALAYDGLNNIDPNFGQGGAASRDLCFWDALVFSGATFFTAGFGTMEPIDRGARAMAVIEAGLGITLIALAIFTVGNRISRS
jgi:uncharacterized protein YjbI with pentapeptide repeats